MKTTYYLIFDGGCSTCSTVATSIEKEAGGKVSTLRIGSEHGQELLHRALPHGHEWRPYLVAVKGDTVTATSGLKMMTRLGRLLGPRRGIRVYNVVRRLGISLPLSSRAESTGILPLSRRAFVKLSGAALALAVVPLSPPSPDIPEARTWKCYATGYMRGNPCCAGIPVTGYGEDINQVNSCNAAKKDANFQASLQGCYAGHLQCKCSQ